MKRIWLTLLFSILCSGCLIIDDTAPVTPINIRIPTLPTPQTDAIPDEQTTAYIADGIYDANDIMNGICFEYAFLQRDTPLVFRNAQEHITFYDEADTSEECRRPVRRNSFEFTDGQILAGIWSYGFGCVAHHNIMNIERNDSTRTILIVLDFATEGDCNYELLRPFWVGIEDPNGYDVLLVVG